MTALEGPFDARPENEGAERSSLFDAARLAEIRHLVTQWISVPNLPDNAIPASPDDVFWLCDQVERLAKALETADAAYSEAINDIGRDLIVAQERALTAERSLRLSNESFVRSGKRG